MEDVDEPTFKNNIWKYVDDVFAIFDLDVVDKLRRNFGARPSDPNKIVLRDLDCRKLNRLSYFLKKSVDVAT